MRPLLQSIGVRIMMRFPEKIVVLVVVTMGLLVGCHGSMKGESPNTLVATEFSVVDIEPPQPKAENYGAPPYVGAFWVEGYWFWEAGAYRWHPGHWEHSRPGLHWVPHRWHHEADGWHLKLGYWESSRF